MLYIKIKTFLNKFTKNFILAITATHFFFHIHAGFSPNLPPMSPEEETLLNLLGKASEGTISEQELGKLQEISNSFQKQLQDEWENADPETKQKMKEEAESTWNMMGIPTDDMPSFEEILGLKNEPKQYNDSMISTTTNVEDKNNKETKQNLKLQKYSIIEIERTIRELIDQLEELRAHTTLNEIIAKKLYQWNDTLGHIIYNIKILQRPEVYEKLATDQQATYEHLLLLHNVLKIQLNILRSSSNEIKEKLTIENPYEILRIPRTATIDEIKKTFEKYKQERTPQYIREQGKKEGATEREIVERIHDAEIILTTLEEQYMKISDPTIKEQTDRILNSFEQHGSIRNQEIENGIKKITDLLFDLVHNKKILEQLDQLVTTFATTAKSYQKTMSTEEEKRKKEQKLVEKIRPSSTPGSYEPFYPPQQPNDAFIFPHNPPTYEYQPIPSTVSHKINESSSSMPSPQQPSLPSNTPKEKVTVNEKEKTNTPEIKKLPKQESTKPKEKQLDTKKKSGSTAEQETMEENEEKEENENTEIKKTAPQPHQPKDAPKTTDVKKVEQEKKEIKNAAQLMKNIAEQLEKLTHFFQKTTFGVSQILPTTINVSLKSGFNISPTNTDNKTFLDFLMPSTKSINEKPDSIDIKTKTTFIETINNIFKNEKDAEQSSIIRTLIDNIENIEKTDLDSTEIKNDWSQIINKNNDTLSILTAINILATVPSTQDTNDKISNAQLISLAQKLVDLNKKLSLAKKEPITIATGETPAPNKTIIKN